MTAKIKEEQLLSERVAKEKEELFSSPPRMDIDRIKFLLSVYQETEGQPPVIKRAKLFERLCLEKHIFIDGNPIVGTLTKYKYGAYPLPEFGVSWMKRGDRFSLQRGQASIGKEEREWIDKAVDYWEDKNVYNRTKEIIIQSRGVDIGVLGRCGVGTEFTPGGFVAAPPDYSQVLNKGLKGVIAEIEGEKAKLDTGNSHDFSKWYFYKGALLCLNAMIKFALRYASLAKEMAGMKENSERKKGIGEHF